MATLIDLVAFLFSKNAGPYLTTFDIVFADEATYRHVRDSKVITEELIAERFHVPLERILSIHAYDAGQIIKFTLIREHSSGDFGDKSVFGSQLWAPLIDVEVPERAA